VDYLASLFHGDREENDGKTVSYESGPSILKEVGKRQVRMKWLLRC